MQLHALKAQGVANLLWAYAVLAHTPSVELLERLEAELGSRIGEVHSQQLANILWGYTTIGHAPGARLRVLLHVRTLSVPPRLCRPARRIHRR